MQSILKNVNKQTKYITFGWIRNQQKLLKLPNIPSLVSAICILYVREDEIFYKISDNGIKRDENAKKVIKEKFDDCLYNNNYGYIQIASDSDYIIQWDLKVITKSIRCGITIGITNFEDVNNAIEECNDMACYMFSENLCITANGWNYYGSYGNSGGFGENGNYFCDGDLVSLNLNLRKGQIKLFVNGQDEGIAFRNISRSDKIKYRLFVTLKNIGDSVKIINFIRK